jgi:hypothetical protein
MYGEGALPSDGDQNGDGVVNALDFNSLASDFGRQTAITPRFDASEFDVSDDPSSIFDINDPATVTFHRNNIDLDSGGSIDTSQDLNIYYGFLDDLDPNDDAIPNQDFDPGVQAPASTDVYVFTIPAGQMSATLEFTTLDPQYRFFKKGITTLIVDQNSGQQIVPHVPQTQSRGVTPNIVGRDKNYAEFYFEDTDGVDQSTGSQGPTALRTLLQSYANSAQVPPNHARIKRIWLVGHGNEEEIGIGRDTSLTVVDGINGKRIILTDSNNQEIDDLTQLFKDATTPDADIILRGCNTANTPDVDAGSPGDTGVNSLAHQVSLALPGRTVQGYRTEIIFIPYTRLYVYARSRTFKDGNLQ